jgi:hypothetical protein
MLLLLLFTNDFSSKEIIKKENEKEKNETNKKIKFYRIIYSLKLLKTDEFET